MTFMFLITILLFAQPLSDELTREDASVVDAAKEAELWVAEGRGTVASIPFKRGNRWGYLDREGRVVIEPHYQRAGSFRYGRAVADRTIINPDGSLAAVEIERDHRVAGRAAGPGVLGAGGDIQDCAFQIDRRR